MTSYGKITACDSKITASYDKITASNGQIPEAVPVSVVGEEDLQNVEHASHLSEDEHSVTPALESAQQDIKGLQLATVVLNEAQVGELNALLLRDHVQPCSVRGKQCTYGAFTRARTTHRPGEGVGSVKGGGGRRGGGDHKDKAVDDPP